MTMAKRLSRGGAALALTLFAAAALFAAGCGQATNAPQAATTGKAPEKAVAEAGGAEKGHGWWCTEHGVPEADCALCNDKVAAEYKKKGDWCKEHDRPESQCFLCDPSRMEKFAAQYRAKYGQEPPPADAENVKGGTAKAAGKK
jgi:cobalt-zinc-cadmium efflux system membrane fusion protein